MKMDFKKAAKLGNYLSKDFAESLFELLVNYNDISASEAASRLDLHISTAQEFLEAMASLDIVSKQEVYERKRPYFRYALKTDRITMDIDLSSITNMQLSEAQEMNIREAKAANARFTTARSGDIISSVAIWTGRGRNRKERRISLTPAQGAFMYHLPFPDGRPLTTTEIMSNAGMDDSHASEITDIVELLIEYKVIEVVL
jgi:predicted transcriptional regulator